ncbi:MAG: hypothetical protein IBX69_18455, partial [Anaerolineales bacterium]|nr:hypothetical protein [Anaerolineales bacterium]
GRLDLLALDPLGRYVVIEVKAGALSTDVITQAIYYAAQIDNYPFETLESKIQSYLSRDNQDLKTMLLDRGLEQGDLGKNKETLIYLVGTQRTPGIDTMLDYMAKKFRIPLTVITFEVFQLENGQRILVREITEADITTIETKRKTERRTADVEKVCALADKNGVGQEFRYILAEARKLGLHFRPYVRSIMYTHPNQKTRMLFTVWAHQKSLTAYIGYEAFVEYYPVSEQQVAEALGPAGNRKIDMEQAKKLMSGLERLLSYGAIEDK